MSCGLLWCEMQSKVSKPVKLPSHCVCVCVFMRTVSCHSIQAHCRSLLIEQQMELSSVVWCESNFRHPVGVIVCALCQSFLFAHFTYIIRIKTVPSF